MDKTIEFQRNVSILVGINGSGKTSILNIINWLLKPSISELCLIEFESLELNFIYLEDEYKIRCHQNDAELIIEVTNLTKSKKLNSIQATFKHHPKFLTQNESLKQSLREEDCYGKLGPERHERETWSFLFSSLPKPVVIGLDRSLYAKEGEEVRVETASISILKRQQLLAASLNSRKSPLDRVKELLAQEQNACRNAALSLYQELSEKIMLSTFGDIQTAEKINLLLRTPPPTQEQLDTLEKQVINFLRESSEAQSKKASKKQAEAVLNKVQQHFIALKKLVNSDFRSNNLLYLANISQFNKINSLVADFDAFETNLKLLYEPSHKFLTTVNRFFEDSSKQLYHDRESNSIRFRLLDKNGAVLGDGRDILNLSSGEKQLLILLTYVRHLSKQSVFIIDEPELSLHPKWQLEFLSAIEAIMPQGAQLILATHSPEIIGEHKNRCTVLLPYNDISR